MAEQNCNYCGALGGLGKTPCLACRIERYGFKAPRWAITARREPRPPWKPRGLAAAFLAYCTYLIDCFIFTELRINKVCEYVQWERKTFDGEQYRSGKPLGTSILADVNKSKDRRKRGASEQRLRLIGELRDLTHGLCAYCSQPLAPTDGYDTVLPLHIAHSMISDWQRMVYLRVLASQNNARACCVDCNAGKGRYERAGTFALRSLWRNFSTMVANFAEDGDPPLLTQFSGTQFVFSAIPQQPEIGNREKEVAESYGPLVEMEVEALKSWMSTFALRVVCYDLLDEEKVLFVAYSEQLRHIVFASFEKMQRIPKHFGFLSLGTLTWLPARLDGPENAKRCKVYRERKKKLAAPI